MNFIKNMIRKRPVLFGGIAFAIASLLLNYIYIVSFNMAHIYDIVHAFPTIFVYGPIADKLGHIASPFLFLPLAVILDFICGLLFGWISKKFTKTTQLYLVALLLLFGFYWVVITYQWLLII